MSKIIADPRIASQINGGDLKTYLENAYAYGNRVYIDSTLNSDQAKLIKAKGALKVEAKRYRFSTGKPFTSKTLKWANENAYTILENKLLNSAKPELCICVYGLKVINASNVFRKDSTAKDFLSIFNNYIVPTFGAKEIDEVRYTDLLVWQAEFSKTLSASRVKQIRTVLNQIIESGVSDGLIDKNPLNRVKAPKI